MTAEKALKKDAIPRFELFGSLIAWTLTGAVLAFAHQFATEPVAVSVQEERVQVVEGIPEALVFDTVFRYYEAPSRTGLRSDVLSRKLFEADSNRIEVREAELNGWANVALQPPRTAVGGNAEEGTASVVLEPQAPVFKIAKEQLHIVQPVSLSFFDTPFTFLLLASGDFETQDEVVRFRIDALRLNSAAIPFHRQLFSWLTPRLLRQSAAHPEVEKIQSAWNLISQIEIGDAGLVVHRR